MMLPVVILAGGLATRLHPITQKIPKSLVEINGEPFIIHQLRLLYAQNIRQVTLCVGHLGEMIQEQIGDGQSLGMQITYSYDGDRLLGTGGAIKKALSLLGDHFFVLYGDSYLPCDYAAVQDSFFASRKKALMTIYNNQGRWDSSNVEFSNGTLLAYGKKNRTPQMTYIDYGLGVFDSAAFDLVPPQVPFDLADLYQQLLTRGELAAYEVQQRFYEIGSHTGLEELRLVLTKDSNH